MDVGGLTSLRIVALDENGLDINDGRAVDRFDGSNAQSRSSNLADGHSVQPQRVGSMRRSSCEYAPTCSPYECDPFIAACR